MICSFGFYTGIIHAFSVIWNLRVSYYFWCWIETYVHYWRSSTAYAPMYSAWNICFNVKYDERCQQSITTAQSRCWTLFRKHSTNSFERKFVFILLRKSCCKQDLRTPVSRKPSYINTFGIYVIFLERYKQTYFKQCTCMQSVLKFINWNPSFHVIEFISISNAHRLDTENVTIDPKFVETKKTKRTNVF